MNVNITIHVHCKDIKSKFIKLIIGHSVNFYFPEPLHQYANISTCSKLPVYTDSKFINPWSHGHNWGPKGGAKFNKDQST